MTFWLLSETTALDHKHLLEIRVQTTKFRFFFCFCWKYVQNCTIIYSTLSPYECGYRGFVAPPPYVDDIASLVDVADSSTSLTGGDACHRLSSPVESRAISVGYYPLSDFVRLDKLHTVFVWISIHTRGQHENMCILSYLYLYYSCADKRWRYTLKWIEKEMCNFVVNSFSLLLLLLLNHNDLSK